MLKSLGITIILLSNAGTAMSASQDDKTEPRTTQSARSLYTVQCSGCHGADMNGGQFGPTLQGAAFAAKWKGRGTELLKYISQTMPPSAGGTLSDPEYAAVAGLIIEANGGPTSAASAPELQASGAEAAPPSGDAVYGSRTLDPNPFYDVAYKKETAAREALLSAVSPVTEAQLRSPPDSDWLQWRRTRDSLGFSPLRQIDKSNVAGLRLKWSWSLKPGKNEIAPIVHDGVMFINSATDVEALDAATGTPLWRYTRDIPAEYRGPLNMIQRSIAIYGRMLYVTTADRHLIALDIGTGKIVWDTEIMPASMVGGVLTAGPLVANGVLIQGTSTGPSCNGGCYVVGIDAATGKRLWRFDTIAKPGSPGGGTWNDTPAEERSGAAVWVTGSYDPDLDLVYVGTAGTYDISRLLKSSPTSPERSSAGLFTNSTLALRPKTGKLVWYHQHFPREVWDLDEVFERALMTLPVNGRQRELVVSSGKIGIVDALDRKDGKYVFSIDLGLNNIVTAIDPRTGRRTVDPAKVPAPNGTVHVCPSLQGARNWLAISFNPKTNILYLPLQETCMDLTWVEPGGPKDSRADMAWTTRPMPNSDGLYGRYQAIDMSTRKTLWMRRFRAVPASSLLGTAGGLIFAGNTDRWFMALDEQTGETLWQTRLGAAPNATPVTYSVDGKQYVAIVSGGGASHEVNIRGLTPENPASPAGTTLMVFGL